jgi:hypothetical protein
MGKGSKALVQALGVGWLSSVCSLAAAQTAAATPTAPAAEAGAREGAVGFSKLLFRIANEERIAQAKDDFAVFILEGLRARGLNAVGAENLVFDHDRSGEADFILGGTVRELECLEHPHHVNCRIAIEWQVLEVRSGTVRYTALTRGVALGIVKSNPAALGKALVLSALESLTKRSTFRNQLKIHEARHLTSSTYRESSFRSCDAPERPMPESAEHVLPATAVVQHRDSFGSGFFLNSEGLLLTAAHVVGPGPIEVRLRDGTKHPARLVRSVPSVDVALLKVDGVSSGACLPLAPDPQPVGSEVYAIGAPASQDLAFSLTRGIVSGTRELDGQQLLQTDASVNPGNSGGPLVDAKGRATAIVSFKLAGRAIQGISFGVPVPATLRALALKPDTVTDSTLLEPQPNPSPSSATSGRPFVDGADALPSIDPEGDRARADALRERRREELRDERTPGFVGLMRWGGLGLAGAGMLAGVVTFQSYDEKMTTKPEYDRLTTLNTLSWIGAGLGLGAFALSYAFVPSVEDSELDSVQGRVGVTTMGDVQVEVKF